MLGVQDACYGESRLVGLVRWGSGLAKGELDGEAGAGGCGVSQRGEEGKSEGERERGEVGRGHGRLAAANPLHSSTVDLTRA